MKSLIKRIFPEQVYVALVYVYGKFIQFLLLCFRCLPLHQNKILCICYYGKGMECNPKYIYQEILRRSNNYKLYWAISNKDFANDESGKIKFIKYKGLVFYYHLATSKMWISNVRLPYYWSKRREQIYIQTWHGGIALKKVEADVIEHLSKAYVKHAMHDAVITNLMISNSTWLTDLYRRAFWYNGEILQCGLPREDIFALPYVDVKNKVFSFYKIDRENTHILLYAPTFRVDASMKCYDINFNKLIDVLETKWGGIWKILIRLHPNIQNKQNNIEYDENILNGSQYADINDLIIASDVIVSDYSSCMFDGLLARKKVFLYASDIEDYEKDRGTLFEFEALPFSLATSNDELINVINDFDEKEYTKKCINFKGMLGFFELGNGSLKVVDWIERNLGL